MENTEQSFAALAFSPNVIRRSSLIAMIVGLVLVAINHGDALLRGSADSWRLFRIALTFLTPYVVATVSTVLSMRDRDVVGNRKPYDPETLMNQGDRVPNRQQCNLSTEPFLKCLPANATLMDVFLKFPNVAIPLMGVHAELMHSPSQLSAAERELLAAFVSGLNRCDYCRGIHETASHLFGTDSIVLKQLLDDIDTASIEDRLNPVFHFSKKLTTKFSEITQADIETMREAGWQDESILQVILISGLFSMMNRIVAGSGLKSDPFYMELAGRRIHEKGYSGLRDLIQASTANGVS